MLDANLKNSAESVSAKRSAGRSRSSRRSTTATSRANCRACSKKSPRCRTRITVIEQHGDDERKPSFSIGEPGKDAGIRFAGIPMGHEFTSLVLALLQVGGHPVKLDDAVIEQIRNLDGDYRIRNLYLAVMPELPGSRAGAERDGGASTRASASVTIDGALFQDEVEARQIMAVPTVFLNGEVFGQGRTGVKEILAKLDTNAGARAAKELRKEAGVRRADRRRRTCRRGGGDLRGAQGHRDGRGRRTLRRPGARYAGDRELRLGARRPKDRSSRRRSSST